MDLSKNSIDECSLIEYSSEKIIFKQIQLIFGTENLLWKPKNCHFQGLFAKSVRQIWKNYLAGIYQWTKLYIMFDAPPEIQILKGLY